MQVLRVPSRVVQAPIELIDAIAAVSADRLWADGATHQATDTPGTLDDASMRRVVQTLLADVLLGAAD